jgi:hypothetical protein
MVWAREFQCICRLVVQYTDSPLYSSGSKFNVVGLATRLRDGRFEALVPVKARNLTPEPSCFQWVPGFFLGAKRPERKVKHSPLLVARLRICGAVFLLSLYAFKAQTKKYFCLFGNRPHDSLASSHSVLLQLQSKFVLPCKLEKSATVLVWIDFRLGCVYHFIIIIIIIIINIQGWAIWPVPSPKLQLLSPSFLRSPNCSLSLWAVVKWF